jgi:8-oxo-dGTP pyrophosphatase MutT (NUDIX family)
MSFTDHYKEYENDRNNFITDFQYCMIKMIRNEDITKFSIKKRVFKVSFVPIYLKDREAFVTLAKHNSGKRKDQYSFIGGGTDCSEEDWTFKKDYEKIQIIARTLFDEVYEEFGIMLNWEYFKQSLIDVRRTGSFLLFYVNITDIEPESWKNMQNERINIPNLGRRFLEIEEIKNYNLNIIKNEYERLKDLDTNKIVFYIKDEMIEISRYVISMNRHLSEMVDKIKKNTNNNLTSIYKFKSIPLNLIHEKIRQFRK